ncbi:hypothetical protein AVEN_25728-1 [Araneus ventricosus]|uniref:Uncharacterized protein n=1 Tax=Araneus ventricosus TaxID=182803 RepID=A0A4Y2PQ35_ARAVE|nr:hypothetical protein AVEN_25728-1 [Araneus ventricosus]
MNLPQSKQIYFLDIQRLEVLCEEEGRPNSFASETNRRWSTFQRGAYSQRRKLLAAIGQVAAHGQKYVAESPICGDVDHDVSNDTDVMDPQDNILNFCGKEVTFVLK